MKDFRKQFEEQLEAVVIGGKIVSPCIYKKIYTSDGRYVAYSENKCDIYNSYGQIIKSDILPNSARKEFLV